MTIPALYHLFQKIRDPDADQRDRLEKLIQANPQLASTLNTMYGQDPQALQGVTGQAPRFFGDSGYNSLVNTIKNAPVDPKILADKFQANENKNLLGLQTMMNPAIADARQNVDMSNVSPDMLQGLTQEQIDRYKEAQATAPSGRIQTLTPAQRLQQSAELKQTGAQTDTSIAQGKAANFETKLREFQLSQGQDTKKEDDAAKLIRGDVFAKYGTGGKLLRAFRGQNKPEDGNLSPEQISSLERFPESSKLIDDLRDQDYKDTLAELDKKRTAFLISGKDYLEQADIKFATNLSEKLNGKITPTDALSLYKQIRADPKLRETLTATKSEDITDPKQQLLWDTNNAINNFKAKLGPKDYAKAYSDFQKAASPILEKIRGTGKERYTEEQIPGALDELNAVSAGIFLPYGVTPLQYSAPAHQNTFAGIKTSKSFNPEVVAGDKELLKIVGIKPKDIRSNSGPGTKSDITKVNPQTTEDQFKSFEALGKKYPNETDEQIKQRVLRGEKP